MQIADCKLKTSDGFKSADLICNLKSAICNLKSEICNLQSAIMQKVTQRK
jgi:hypothetical protein